MSDNIHSLVSFGKMKQYPVYQLWAVNGNKKTPAMDVLKIGTLTVLLWLREKMPGEIPNSLKYPNPEEYQDFDMNTFSSFIIGHFNSIESVYLENEQSVSFRIEEDGSGASIDDTPIVHGRTYITNIGMRIVGDHVEFGFKAEVNEPIDVSDRAKYYRMHIIKCLVKNELVQLKQEYNIKMDYYHLNTNDDIEKFNKYLANKKVHLPVIVFSECEDENEPEQPKIDEEKLQELFKDKTPRNIFPPTNVKIDFGTQKRKVPEQTRIRMSNKNEKNEKNENKFKPIPQKVRKYIYPYSESDILDKFLGYAHIFLLPHDRIDEFNRKFSAELVLGDAVIVQPKCFGKEKKYFRKNELVDNNEIKRFKKHIFDYLRSRNVDFGKVIFFSEAIVKYNQNAISHKESKEEILAEHKRQINFIEKKYLDKIDNLKREIGSLTIQLTRKQNELTKEKNSHSIKSDEHNENIKKAEDENKLLKDKYSNMVNYFHKRDERPKTKNEISEWLRKNFADRIFLHERAEKLLQKWNPNDINLIILLYDALEYLGSEYYDYYFGTLSNEEAKARSKDKYNNNFDISPCGDKNVKTFSNEYKVKYKKVNDTKAHEVGLDKHLKNGNKSKDLIRIYFFTDDQRKLIVIGSLPEHLSTASYE